VNADFDIFQTFQKSVTDYCRKHVDSRWLWFSGHHRAINANMFVAVVNQRCLEYNTTHYCKVGCEITVWNRLCLSHSCITL